MPQSAYKWNKIFGSRLARNIYFWIIIFLFLYVANNDGDTYERRVYNLYKVTTTVLLIIMTVINNFVLVPFMLTRGKKFLYMLSVVILTLATSLAFVVLLKDMMHRYPGIEIYEVSLITSPVGSDWSFPSILEELPVYAIGLGSWVLIFTMAWYMQDHTKQEKKAKEATHKQMQAELDLLRNQLNPHFLFNTLNNIYGLSLQKSDKAPESILKLSSIMRYMLYDTDVPLVSFEKEKEVMQAYIDMELLRLQDTGNLRFVIEADKDYMMPPLLWLPVLENIFKHGTRFAGGEYRVDYAFTINNNKLHISAENNKSSVDAKRSGGMGLTNLRKRLEILYPGKHAIEIYRDAGKYKIELMVNLS